MKERILFTHIPKTAGTSFKEEIIRNNYDNIFIYRGMKSIPHIYINNPSFITGHFPFGLNRYFFNKYKYLTFFRDPVERAISHYYFILQSKYPTYEHPQYQVCKSMPIQEIYKKGKLLDNLQTRFISGSGYKSGKCTSYMLFKAKKNLDNHYPVFGIQEHYEISIKLICLYFNLNLPTTSDNKIHNKKTFQKPVVDETNKESLRLQHMYDIDLYKHAMIRFEKVAQEYGLSNFF